MYKFFETAILLPAYCIDILPYTQYAEKLGPYFQQQKMENDFLFTGRKTAKQIMRYSYTGIV